MYSSAFECLRDLLNDEYLDLPPFGRVRLADVYEELRVSIGSDSAANAVNLDSSRPLRLRDLVELRREGDLALAHRWLLRGPPGSGKTTLLRKLAMDLARAYSPNEGLVPLYLPAADLVASPDGAAGSRGTGTDLAGCLREMISPRRKENPLAID